MYLAASNGIFALVPETGQKLWHYETTQVALRSLAYWPGDKQNRSRGFAAVKGGMIALDAATGKPAPGFATEGPARPTPMRTGRSAGCEPFAAVAAAGAWQLS